VAVLILALKVGIFALDFSKVLESTTTQLEYYFTTSTIGVLNSKFRELKHSLLDPVLNPHLASKVSFNIT